MHHFSDETASPLQRAAQLRKGLLGHWTSARLACGLIGGALLPLVTLLLANTPSATQATLAALHIPLYLALLGTVLLTFGELIERHLFFIASVSPRMPGGVQ